MLKRLTILIALLSGASYAQTYTWHAPMYLSTTPDSFYTIQYRDGLQIASRKTPTLVTGTKVPYDTASFVATDNALNQVVYKIYWAGMSYPDGYGHTWDLNKSYGDTESIRLVYAYWSTAPDSAALEIRRDHILAQRTKRGAVYEYDTTVNAVKGKNNSYDIFFYWPGGDISLWTWSWDLTDTAEAGTPTATAASTCRVWGFVRSASTGSLLKYAKVKFELAGTARNACDTAITVPAAYETETDGLGYFEADLVWSACMNNVAYNVTVYYDNNKTYTKSLTVPSLGTYRMVW